MAARREASAPAGAKPKKAAPKRSRKAAPEGRSKRLWRWLSAAAVALTLALGNLFAHQLCGTDGELLQFYAIVADDGRSLLSELSKTAKVTNGREHARITLYATLSQHLERPLIACANRESRSTIALHLLSDDLL